MWKPIQFTPNKRNKGFPITKRKLTGNPKFGLPNTIPPPLSSPIKSNFWLWLKQLTSSGVLVERMFQSTAITKYHFYKPYSNSCILKRIWQHLVIFHNLLNMNRTVCWVWNINGVICHLSKKLKKNSHLGLTVMVYLIYGMHHLWYYSLIFFQLSEG